MPEEPTYNARQAALRVGVAERTIRRWVKDPHDPLPATKPGREFIIRESDLLAYAERNIGSPRIQVSDHERGLERELAELRGRYLELKEEILPAFEQRLRGEVALRVRAEFERDQLQSIQDGGHAAKPPG